MTEVEESGPDFGPPHAYPEARLENARSCAGNRPLRCLGSCSVRIRSRPTPGSIREGEMMRKNIKKSCMDPSCISHLQSTCRTSMTVTTPMTAPWQLRYESRSWSLQEILYPKAGESKHASLESLGIARSSTAAYPQH